MKNKLCKQQLIDDFGKTCFLLGKIEKRNPLTYHHIIPKRHGGKDTYCNGALLCRLEHDMFNSIENINQRYADDLNAGFQEYKRSREYQLLIQMRYFVELELYHRGYTIEDKGKILTLKRGR